MQATKPVHKHSFGTETSSFIIKGLVNLHPSPHPPKTHFHNFLFLYKKENEFYVVYHFNYCHVQYFFPLLMDDTINSCYILGEDLVYEHFSVVSIFIYSIIAIGVHHITLETKAYVQSLKLV
jgi:hypothetical protein